MNILLEVDPFGDRTLLMCWLITSEVFRAHDVDGWEGEMPKNPRALIYVRKLCLQSFPVKVWDLTFGTCTYECSYLYKQL